MPDPVNLCDIGHTAAGRAVTERPAVADDGAAGPRRASRVALKNTSTLAGAGVGETVKVAVGGVGAATVMQLSLTPRRRAVGDGQRRRRSARRCGTDGSSSVPVADVPSPKSHEYVHSVEHATPLLVLVDASNDTVWNACGVAGVNVKSATRFGFVGRMTPCGISRMSICRVNSPRKSPSLPA